MSDAPEPAILPEEIMCMIASYVSFPEVSRFRRVSKLWEASFRRAAKGRKSVSLAPFANHGFHTYDSITASLLSITRDDMLGMAFYHFYSQNSSKCYDPNEKELRKFFASHPDIENLEILWLTQLMLDILRQQQKVKRLAFHFLANPDMDGSLIGEMLPNLEMIAFSEQTSDEFVRDSLLSLKKARIISFIGPSDPFTFQVIQLETITTAASDQVREIYLATMRVLLGDRQANERIKRSKVIGHVTLFETLNPDPENLSLFLQDILPLFQHLQILALGLVNTRKSIYRPDDSDEVISLSSAIPDLISLTLTMDFPFLPFAEMFGRRERLQTLKLSGEPDLRSPQKFQVHDAYISLQVVRDVTENAPNLVYFCATRWTHGSDLDPDLTMEYVREICKLKKLRVLHLPHTTIDEEVIQHLNDHLLDLRRIEFVGQVREDVVSKALKLKSDLKLRFQIIHQNFRPFCVCPYSQTNCRLVPS